jgi:hypothetical protein
MAHIRRIRPARAEGLIPVQSRDPAARLKDRRLGGMVVIDYLHDLFAASPYEVFSRVTVLSVLDHVKKDRDLFPEGPRVLSFRPRAGRPC